MKMIGFGFLIFVQENMDDSTYLGSDFVERIIERICSIWRSI